MGDDWLNLHVAICMHGFFLIMRFAFTFILGAAVKTLFRLKLSIILVEVNT